MLQVAYFGLVGAAFFLNRRDPRMLLLTLAVGVSVFLPAPKDTAFAFYSFCMAAELVVGLCAVLLKARGSELVVSLCVVLEIAHMMGYILNGYPPLSAYRVIVPVLETAQLLACICMSPALHTRLQNRIQ